MWGKRGGGNSQDYRSLMETLNNDANQITQQLDSLATPRVSTLEGGLDPAKLHSTQAQSSGAYTDNGSTVSSLGRRSFQLSSPAQRGVPKELQLRTDAIGALKKVVGLLDDKNTPPTLEMALLEKGQQLLESLRTSRERIARKNIRKGSYLTLMSALNPAPSASGGASNKGNTASAAAAAGNTGGRAGSPFGRKGTGAGGGVPAPSANAAATAPSQDASGNPWVRLLEYSYWWPHQLYAVLSGIEARTFSPPDSFAATAADQSPLRHPAMPGGSSQRSNTSSSGRHHDPHVTPPRRTAGPPDALGHTAPPTASRTADADDADEESAIEARNRAMMDGSPPQPQRAAGVATDRDEECGGGGERARPRRPTTFIPSLSSDVPQLFYDESELALQALELIPDDPSKSPVRWRRQPVVNSDEYNEALREYFIHAAASPEHPMHAAIAAFVAHNHSPIMRLAVPDGLLLPPARVASHNNGHRRSSAGPGPSSVADDALFAAWDIELAAPAPGSERPDLPEAEEEPAPVPPPPSSLASLPRGSGPNSPVGQRAPDFLSVSARPSTAKRIPGGRLKAAADGPDSPRALFPTTNGTTTGSTASMPNGSPSCGGDERRAAVCLWGVFGGPVTERLFLRDRLHFIQALCETVLEKMFAEKHIPVIVTSSHVEAARSVVKDVSHAVQQRGGGNGSQYGGDGGSERTSNEGSVRGSVVSSIRPSTTATSIANGGARSRRVVLDVTHPFVEVLPEVVDCMIEMMVLRKICSWAESYQRRRRAAMSPDALEDERAALANLTPQNLDTAGPAGRMLLDAAAAKLHSFLDALVDAMDRSTVVFVEEFYERLLDALVITYNIAETARVQLPGQHTGADDIFPAIVYIMARSRSSVLLSAVLRWAGSSSVASRLPPFLSKGLESYVLQSFAAACNAVVSCQASNFSLVR